MLYLPPCRGVVGTTAQVLDCLLASSPLIMAIAVMLEQRSLCYFGVWDRDALLIRDLLYIKVGCCILVNLCHQVTL